MPLDITTFAIKWQQTQLTERSAYQQHFRDLCEALGVPHPTEEDLVGNNYTFEKHVTKVSEGKGFADVWKRDAFAFEYKLPGGNLKKAYKQLIDYHEDLENPPLLIVCDFKRFEVHTKFDSQRSRVYAFDLEELRLNKPVPTSAVLPQDVLRYVFGDRNMLRPEAVTERVTRDAATDLLNLAQQLELERSASPTPHTKEEIAHFLIRIVFCLFADSIGLIPNNVFRKLVQSSRTSRINFNRKLPGLFAAMGTSDSYFGADDIPYFNGGLFEQEPKTIELNNADCDILRNAARHDWSQIEPSIFGTLFERSLDAAKRSMIGAHYTSPEDILLLVEPVVMAPLRRQWAATQAAIEAAIAEEEQITTNLSSFAPTNLSSFAKGGAPASPTSSSSPPTLSSFAEGGGSAFASPTPALTPATEPHKRIRRDLRANRTATKLLQDWAADLQKVRILDPACGSGNFLYIAMKQLLDLWQTARIWAGDRGLILPVESMPTPAQLYGIEIDFYAHEIASAVVWIGLLQWKRDHSYNDQPKPILKKLSNIEHADAIMRYDENGKPYEPDWPAADYIVGNPPFLGGKKLRTELGDHYVNCLFFLYKTRVNSEADLVTYWFWRARERLADHKVNRVGFIATQAIRAGASRAILEDIRTFGNIFWAWSNREWMVEGAAVRVCMVAFDGGEEEDTFLNGVRVAEINADLSSGVDTIRALSLAENSGICFMGTTKVGPFDIPETLAHKMLAEPTNPNGKGNADVVKPWINALDLNSRNRRMFIIDFGINVSMQDASLYQAPFEYVKNTVFPVRQENNRYLYRKHWWLLAEGRPAFRKAITNKSRFIVTPRVSKHRFFQWISPDVIPDSRLFAFAKEDDYTLGVLQSRLHEVWSMATSSRHGVAGDVTYNAASCFDTFPFPYPPGTEPTEADSPIVRAIADAARELVRLRDAWLNPPNASDDDLKTRTLTRLYNARPEWLVNAHRTLDEAVFAAYGWSDALTSGISDQDILARLLALNHERAHT